MISETVHTFTIDRRWVMAGNATFTVNNAAGKHYTLKIVRKDSADRPPVWFANLLTSPDNETGFTYIGIVENHDVLPVLRMTKKSRLHQDSPSVKVLVWALRRIWLQDNAIPAGYGINGEGRCGACGRKLTHPDGVADDGFRFGFGPVCWERIQGGE